MEPEAKYTVVGTAVLVLIAMVAAALLWLRTTGEGGDERTYKIYFERQSLEGLQPRSEVRMRGIRVGSVTGFRISSWRPGAVEVMVRVDGAAPVRQSTRAVVERHLVTGIASILLVNLNEESPPLTQAPQGEVYPVIAEGESQLEQVSQSLQELALRATETMQRVSTTLSPENQRAFTALLENLNRLAHNAERGIAGLDRTVASVGAAADEVRVLTRAMSEDAGRLTARYEKLGEEATVAAREAAAAMRQVSADVARISQRVDALLASGDVELRITAQELRATADALGVVARRLNDPRSVLWGPPEGGLGPGEAR
ncbi:MAG TPA: MlaD family protein [Burkholderiales bacterium]|nr:MlaD family protein [Burkholderiales bacterium]